MGTLSHHLLRLRDGNATEELVVAEDLLVPRGQVSCSGWQTFIKTVTIPKLGAVIICLRISS